MFGRNRSTGRSKGRRKSRHPYQILNQSHCRNHYPSQIQTRYQIHNQYRYPRPILFQSQYRNQYRYRSQIHCHCRTLTRCPNRFRCRCQIRCQIQIPNRNQSRNRYLIPNHSKQRIRERQLSIPLGPHINARTWSTTRTATLLLADLSLWR